MKLHPYLTWSLRLLAAAIMLQTLFFKFTAAPESVYIFTTVGIEPYGRILTGVVELVASLLLLMPRTTAFGAALGLGTMLGAIASHLGILGIEVLGDGGKLFLMALVTALACLILLIQHFFQIHAFIGKWQKRVFVP